MNHTLKFFPTFPLLKSHMLPVGVICGSQKCLSVVWAVETLADFSLVSEKGARTGIKQKRKSTPWCNKPRQLRDVGSQLPLVSVLVFCEPSPVRREAKVVVFILREASWPSQLTSVMFVLSRGPMSRENKEYFANVQVFFVRTKPWYPMFSPNTCCLLGWDDQEHMLSVSCSENCAQGEGGGETFRRGKDTLNKKQSCFLHLHMCTWKGPHRALPEVLLWMGRSGPHKQLLLMRVSVKLSELHSFAITVLALRPLCNSSFIHFGLSRMTGGINWTKKSLQIQITYSPKAGLLFLSSLSPENP